MHPWSKRVFLFCFVCFSFYIIGALVYFNNFNDEKNYISKASFKKKDSWSTGAVTKMRHTHLYTL